ncbi:OmpA family protein [Pseudopedobacter beijingensis]|uniref:OmpA family protein n=1 Tax=Pseudopedobacter beijingensis TaxID=1207056 RepID=A0ABW4IAW6_9SPHI
MKTTKLRISVFTVALAIGASSIFSSCETVKNMNNTTKGAGIGTAAGAGIGALIGGKAGNTAVGAIIGGALGGTAGALIGKKMDKQAKEIEAAIPGAEVIPAGEGIIVKFDSGLLFEFNKSTLSSTAKQNIDNLAASLNKYPDTDILVVGHTDNVGTDAVNDRISLERANAVASYATSKGVSGSRLKTSGKGKTEPIASNDTDAGRTQNRRVEIVIVANDAMKAKAKAEVK